MLSFTFPHLELHRSKQPVAIIMFPSRQMQAFALKVVSGKYFVIKRGRQYEGIFELDPTKSFRYGTVPCYFFDSQNGKPVDPIIVHELRKFAKTNKLTKITQRDTIHSNMLRSIVNTGKVVVDAVLELKDKVIQRRDATNEAINEFVNETSGKEDVPPDQVLSPLLTSYLSKKGLLSPDEKGKIDASVDQGNMDFDTLTAELRAKEILRIREPLDVKSHIFLDDFGAYNPEQMSSFIDRLRLDDKGLKNMTSTPIKNWIPASLVMALLIGGSIAVIVLVNNMADIQRMFSGILP